MTYTLYRYTKRKWGDSTRTDVTAGLVLPILLTERLDETLDSATVSLMTSEEMPIPAFTRFLLTVSDGTDSVDHYLVADGDAVDIEIPGSAYLHVLSLVEASKYLERIKCDNLAFTNRLYNRGTYAERVTVAWATALSAEAGDDFFYTDGDAAGSPVSSWYEQGGRLPSEYFAGSVLRNLEHNRSYPTTRVSTTVTLSRSGTDTALSGGVIPSTLAAGAYALRIVETRTASGSSGLTTTITLTGTASIEVKTPAAVQSRAYAKYTYATAIKRLLRCCHLRRTTDTGYLRLDEDILPRLAGECPEYVVTGATLWEALQQFGGKLHAIPYLKDWTTVSYLFLDRIGTSDDLRWYADDDWSAGADARADCLTSDAQHALLADNDEDAVMVEPWAGNESALTANDGRTLRTDSGSVSIDNDSVCIRTAMPIHGVRKLMLQYGTSSWADVTDHLLEHADYLLLPDRVGAVNRGNTLYYTRGSNTISGMCTVPKSPFAGGDLISQQALKTILGLSFTAATTPGNDPDKLCNVRYQISYLPYVDVTLRQYRTELPECECGEITYNQSADLIDLGAYGDHVQSAVVRSGNATGDKTYFADALSEIPALGVRAGRYYASTVAMELYLNHIKATVTWSKDFNRLCEQVGINRAVRQYEISETECYRRNVGTHEFLRISTDPATQHAGSRAWSIDRILGYWAAPGYADPDVSRPAYAVVECYNHPYEARKNSFIIFGSNEDSKYITIASLWTGSAYDVFYAVRAGAGDVSVCVPNSLPFDGIYRLTVDFVAGTYTIAPSRILLPVACCAYGASIAAMWSMVDNYSAGDRSAPSSGDDDEHKDKYRLQHAVPYADEFGRAERMRFAIFAGAPGAGAGDVGHDLPAFVRGMPAGALIDYWAMPHDLWLDKDSRERISCTAQLHVVTDAGSGVLIGQGITSALPYLGKRHTLRWVVLKHTPSIYGSDPDNIVMDVPMPTLDETTNPRTLTFAKCYPATSAVAGYAMLVDGELGFFVPSAPIPGYAGISLDARTVYLGITADA